MNNGSKKCHLVLAGEGEIVKELIDPNDYIVAVDGGYNKCVSIGLTPSMAVGDFDSLGFVPSCGNVVKLKAEKDLTDSFAAVLETESDNFSEYIIHCGLGGRLSHTLANIGLLEKIYDLGKDGLIASESERVHIIRSAASFSEGGYLSLITLTEEAVVSIKNCKYSGEFILKRDASLGVSNEPLKGALVTVKSGKVLAIEERM